MNADEIRAMAASTLQGAASSQSVAAATDKAPEIPVVSETASPQPKEMSLEEQVAQLQLQNKMLLAVASQKDPVAAAAIVGGPRTYHSTSQFTTIHVMRKPGHCDAVQFFNGKLVTDDPAVIKYIEDAIEAGNGGFSREKVTKKTQEQQAMEADLQALAVTARDKMIKAGESVV